MDNINKIEEYMVDKKVLTYHGSSGKDYQYYIKEINNDLVTIVVDAPIKTPIWSSDHQLWTLDTYNLLSHSKETNKTATWGN
jgi:hypothetical protein